MCDNNSLVEWSKKYVQERPMTIESCHARGGGESLDSGANYQGYQAIRLSDLSSHV